MGVLIKTAILEDEGKIVFALGEVEGTLLGIGDEEEAGEALIDLGTSAPVGMGMIPVGAG